MTAALSGPILTAAEMRAAELASGVPLSELMERAGAAVAEAVWRFGGGRDTLIACGPGNNGGDGYVAARLLKERGIDVRVVALCDPKTDLAIAARAGWDGPVEALHECKAAPILVDALFGTGLTRSLDPDTTTALLRLSGRLGRGNFTIAVDVPSGISTDDGATLGASGADLTLALGFLKPAHLLLPSADLCGTVQVATLGLDASSWLWPLHRPTLHAPFANSHKYSRGMVGIIGGAMGGAAMLSAKAAMRLAGYVALAGGRRIGPDALVNRSLEGLLEDDRIDALLIGPGLGRDDKAKAILDRALASPHPLVLDADALTLVSLEQLTALARPVILTPHEGEFTTLFGALPGSKVDRARAAAKQSSATVILKGADTVIAAPDGQAVVAPIATGWLASAGTGDVLAGIAAARLAATGDPFRAACDAAWLHGEAARRAGPALIADELPDHLPAAVSACL